MSRSELLRTATGRLNNGVSQVPPPRQVSEFDAFRRTLPVQQMNQQILRTINENKVVLISGDTGSGKTTQVRSQK